MKAFVSEKDPVWCWTVQQFAGKSIGARIFWESGNPETPEFGLATNHYKGGGKRPSIRVRKASVDPELLWTAAIFELYNIQSGSKYNNLFHRISQTPHDNWVTENCRLEYQGLRRTREFFFSVWQPEMKRKHIHTNSDYWRADLPDSFEKWMKEPDAKVFKKYWSDAYKEIQKKRTRPGYLNAPRGSIGKS